MITLKYWNSLDQKTRTEICRTVNKTGACEQPFHHDFDYGTMGPRVKSILECCNLQKDGTLNITVNIKPIVNKSKTTTSKSKATITNNKSSKQVTKTPSKPEEPKRWKFRRYTEDDPDDGEWVWAYGETEEDARAEIEHDYWGTTELDCYGTF